MIADLVLDLSKNHSRREVGDLVVYCTWYKTPERWEPCLALIKRGDELSPAMAPCIVLQQDAWKFNYLKGDPDWAIGWCINFAEALRMNHSDRRTVERIYDVIYGSISDLVSIPPRPFHDPIAIAELTITNHETGKSRELLITESS